MAVEEYPETSKRMLKPMLREFSLPNSTRKRRSRRVTNPGSPELDIVSAAWDLYAPGLTSDLSIVRSGLQQMLEEDIRAGLVGGKFTLDRVVNDRILKIAQEELRAEGRLKQ